MSGYRSSQGIECLDIDAYVGMIHYMGVKKSGYLSSLDIKLSGYGNMPFDALKFGSLVSGLPLYYVRFKLK